MLNNHDRILETYYREVGSSQMQEQARDRVHWILSKVEGKQVLDAGCSQGLISILLGRAGFDVVGLDIRPEAIAFAHEQLALEPPGVQARVRFMVGDLDDFPAETPPFDTVVLGEVLEHQSHPQRMLAAVRGLCRPGARLVMTVPFGFHPDIDHKQTFYLSDFHALVTEQLRADELRVMHKFICCTATVGDQGDAEPPYRRLLEESEQVFLALEKAHKAEVDALRYMLNQAKKEGDSSRLALAEAEKLQVRNEAELSLLRDELERLRSGALSPAPGAAVPVNGRARNDSVQRSRLGSVPARLLGKVAEVATTARARRREEVLAGRRAVIARAQRTRVAGAAGAKGHALMHRFEPEPLPVRVACILDEFSWENLRHDCLLTRLPMQDWKGHLEETRPDLLLVESAWAGNDGQWKFKITYEQPRADNPLFELLAYCKEAEIPTVFWNKEDPPNYDRFIDAARRFDHIFTTDANCVERYHRDAPDSQTHVLPFAAQPCTQNPVNIDRFDKLGDVCFAGAWYARHPERFEDAKNLINASRRYQTVIYDRYLNHPQHDRYKFPEEYAPLIRGSLSFEEMVEKYRQFRLFLNVNSVKDSPTMFSRRVLELLACGTPVVSGYARGIEEMLGADVVPMCRTEDEARAAIERVLGDPLYRDSIVLRGQRRIFAEHTYRQRLRQVCQAVGFELPAEDDRVTVITATIRHTWIDRLLHNFKRQSHPNKELIVVINHGHELTADLVRERARALGVDDYRVIEAPSHATLGACLNLGLEAATGAYFAKMDDDDYYGEHYLVDSLQALQYSNADCVGKESYFTYAEGPNAMYLQQAGRHHRFTRFVIGTTLVGRTSLFPGVSFGDKRVGEDTEFLERLGAAGKRLYSHSPYNYVKFYAGTIDHHTWKVEESDYLKNAERICSGNHPDRYCF